MPAALFRFLRSRAIVFDSALHRLPRRLVGFGLLCFVLCPAFHDAAGAAQKKPRSPAQATTATRALDRRQAQIQSQVADKTNDLNELRKQIDSLKKEIALAESRRENATDRLKSIEQAISTTQNGLYALTKQRDALRENLKRLAVQEKTLEGQSADQQTKLERLLYRQYLRNDPYSLRVLLSGGDPNQMARDLYYLTRIGNAHRLILLEIEKLIRQKQTLAETTAKRASELSGIESRQKAEHEKLLAQQAQRKEVLDKISAQIQGHRREMGHLERDEKHLSQLVDRLSKILESHAARKSRAERKATDDESIANERMPEAVPDSHFSRLKGSLRLPTRGVVANRFGARRQEGGAWKGLFIRAGSGNEIRGIAGGRVVFADWMRGFGNLMIIDHGGNYLSIYGNNDALLKQLGDSVKGGDVIASVGNSGGNPESGLYFEIRYQGQPIDPLKWVNLK